MNIFKLEYFSMGPRGISASSFENHDKITLINLDLLVSLSDLRTFVLPLTGGSVGFFAIVTMSDGSFYYVREPVYKLFFNFLNQNNLK